MKRYGATTIARWLTEELPEGVLAYIENRGTLHELVGLEAINGHLTPRVKVQRVRGSGGTFTVLCDARLTMGTLVILSLNENLACVTLGGCFVANLLGRCWKFRVAAKHPTRGYHRAFYYMINALEYGKLRVVELATDRGNWWVVSTPNKGT